MTEALAELWHRRIREEWGFADEDGPTLAGLFRQQYRGSRYSWGYPACPDLDDQAKLVELLEADRIGVMLTEEFQLEPEQSHLARSSCPTPRRSTSWCSGRPTAVPRSRAHRTRVHGRHHQRFPAAVSRVTGEDGPGDQVGAERGEDGEVEQPRRRHHRRVVALAHARPRHPDEHAIVTAQAIQIQPSRPP